MNVEEAGTKFAEIIFSDLKHENYKRTLEVAQFARQIMTGEKIDELITDLRRRESQAQKEQRVRITNPLTRPAGNLVLKYYKKLRRTQGIKEVAKWEGEQESTYKERLYNNQKRFYANQSLKEYLFDVLEYASFNDPNMFVVYEGKHMLNEEGEQEEVYTYPFKVPSYQAVWYEYTNGVLDALLIEHKRQEVQQAKPNKKPTSKELSEYYFYIAGYVLHFVEFDKVEIEKSVIVNGRSEQYQTVELPTQTGKKRKFSYFIHANGTKEVPAFRVSAYLDLKTHNKTGVTPLEPVEELLKKLVNINSLEDLTTFLHAMPRRREFVKACKYTDQETGDYCSGGTMQDGSTCSQCNGTGEEIITSEQDSIRIKLPDKFTNEDLPDLAKFAYTEPVDTSLLDYLQSKTDWLLNFIVYAVFTQEYVSMSNVASAAKTATEIGLNYQNIYDQLQPYSELFAQGYELGQRIITQRNNTSSGFKNSFTWPPDFQFETERDLIQKFASAKSAGMPYFVLENINLQMLARQTNSQEMAQSVISWEKWRPFRGVKDELIASILASRKPQDWQRMLYENFDSIQMEVNRKTAGFFYLLEYEQQKEYINIEIELLRQSIMFVGSDFSDIPELEIIEDDQG